MMRLMILILSLLSICSAYAQMPVDETAFLKKLEHKAETIANNDSIRADALLNLAGFWTGLDNEKANIYLRRGRELAKKFPFLLAGVPYYEAGIVDEVDTVRSRALYLRADRELSAFQSNTAYLLRSKAWLNYAASWQLSNAAYAADIILNKAIPMAKKSGKPAMVNYMYADLALLMSDDAELDKAIQYFKIAIEGIKASGQKSARLPTAYVGAARAYIELDSLTRAEQMLTEANAILSVNPESPAYPDYYTVAASLYQARHIYQMALQSAQKGEILARKLNLEYMIPGLLSSKFMALIGLKRYREAETLARNLISNGMLRDMPLERRTVYQQLSALYVRIGDHEKAYHWLAKYTALADSLATLHTKREINALEIKYQRAQDRAHITTLKQRNEQSGKDNARGRKMNVLLALTCTVLAGISILMIQNLRYIRKLRQVEKINADNAINKLRQEKQLELSAALIDGEEKERQRLGADLHDGLGGLLAGTKMLLLSLPSVSQEDVNKLKEKTGNMLDQAIGESRRIARNMMPENLLSFGLNRALKDLCALLSTSDMAIECQIYGLDPGISMNKQIMIYRIVQELITNGIRHSNADWILVQLSQLENVVLITVEDNGKGFNNVSAPIHSGIGLGNIKSRVDFLEGKLEMISGIGEGTSIHIEVNV